MECLIQVLKTNLRRMNKFNYLSCLIVLILNTWNIGFSQPLKVQVHQNPVVAGQFYPAEPQELRNQLKIYFSKAKPNEGFGEVIAIVSPHAGYVFSGQVAASAFNQVDPGKQYKNIFVIGSSHRMAYEGASIYNKGNFITPLGMVKVNVDLADKFINANQVFISKPEAFGNEHSLEVQLPFLQYHLKKEFQIIPILIGAQSPSTSKKIAAALLPYFNKENLFVFSSDFSHYPDYQNAYMIDKQTAEAIISKSPEKFLKTLQVNEDKNIPNLLTSACAWGSLLTLLYMAEQIEGIEIHKIDYMNSGDTEYGDKIKVVGYNAISVILKKQKLEKTAGFTLSDKDKRMLLEIARSSIEYYLINNKFSFINPDIFSPALKSQSGAFVTLNKNGKLRGCIGRMVSDEPLYKVVQEMAVAAAINDYRFDKVSQAEMKNIEIEISVLSPLKKIYSINEIEMGRHGIYIKKGVQSGTFLPQVARETGWTKEDFLGHCARDKAMIGWDGWKNAELFTYEAYIFNEKDIH